MTDTTELSVADIHQLALQALTANGCDEANAAAIATTVSSAERDGSESHGLFRIPGYVASMRSGKVNGNANPTPETLTPAVIRMNGDNGYTPLAHKYLSLCSTMARDRRSGRTWFSGDGFHRL